MELGGWVLAASVAVVAASLAHGTAGFGFGIVALPTLALIMPERVPQTLIMMGLIISLWVVLNDHTAIDRRAASWLIPSRAVGALPGAALVAALSARALDVVFGVVGLLAVLSVLAPRQKEASTRLELAGIGLVAGAMGTATGVGGPPLLPAIGHLEGNRQRATLSAVFAAGSGFSLAALAVVGHVTVADLAVVGVLSPALVLGAWGSKHLLKVTTERVLRIGIVTLGGIASTFVLGRGLSGLS